MTLEDDPIDAKGIGAPQNRSEVMRILNTIKQQNKRIGFLGLANQLVKGKGSIRLNDSRESLVDPGIGQMI